MVGERQDRVLVVLDVFIREHLREVAAIAGGVVNLELRVFDAPDIPESADRTLPGR
jgi:hypothetical protein